MQLAAPDATPEVVPTSSFSKHHTPHNHTSSTSFLILHPSPSLKENKQTRVGPLLWLRAFRYAVRRNFRVVARLVRGPLPIHFRAYGHRSSACFLAAPDAAVRLVVLSSAGSL